jgi:hypothetical protein
MADQKSIDLGKVGITPRGAYSEATAYERLDLIRKNNGAYLSLQNNNLNHPVTDTAWWLCLVSADEALAAADAANEAAEKALGEANSANLAAGNAATQTAAASAAAASANSAAEEALAAKTETESATELCKQLLEAASQVTELGLYPTAMELDYPKEITLGNLEEHSIEATLTPSYAVKNLLFLGDNNAVKVTPDGRLVVLKEGTSVIHVIPTGNTKLYQTIEIAVKRAGIAFASSRSVAILSGDGNFIFN